MAALTIKNIPMPLLSKLRARAAADRRSLNREVIHLLDEILLRFPRRGAAGDRSEAEVQAEAWRRLAGRWISRETLHAETRRIYSRRSSGREVRL